MKYRPEIDGLRTLAVMPVVFYHAGAAGFSGGFIGVDIFFVISGYLITSILISELENGDFSISKFYERRIRRIIPALFFVILCTIPFAWASLSPPAFESFSKSILYVILFTSNIFFWSESGYFDVGGDNKPLLHTWSLAVEEQFYLLFPILLWLIWRFGRRHVLSIVTVMAVCSFLFSFWYIRHDASGNFFLTPSRAWELLGGSICALILSTRTVPGNQALSIAGLIMVVSGVFIFNSSTPWPGPATLLPVVGTMFIILFARENTLTSRFLSLRPIVGVGLISYSLYLWHQPVLAFARLHMQWTPGSKRLILLGLLCIPLAWASWKFVEAPFRRPGIFWFRTRQSVFVGFGVSAIAVGAFAFTGIISRGTMYRYPPEFGVIIGGTADKASNECLVEPSPKTVEHPMQHCRWIGPGETVPGVAIIGDSHAWSVSGELRQDLHERGIGYYFASHQGCLPVPGLEQTTYNDPTSCMRFMDGAVSYARENHIKTLVLVGGFSSYLEVVPFDNGEGGVKGERNLTPEEARALISHQEKRRHDLKERLLALSESFDLIIAEPIPEAGWSVPETMLARSISANQIVDLTTSYAAYKKRNRAALDILRSLPRDHVRLIETEKVFCSTQTGRCLNSIEGVPLYFDDYHLSNAGARLLSPRLADAIEAAHRVSGARQP